MINVDLTEALSVEADGERWAVMLRDPRAPDFFVVLAWYESKIQAEQYRDCVEPIIQYVIEWATGEPWE